MYSVAFVLVLFQFILFVCYSYLVKYGVRDGRFSFFFTSVGTEHILQYPRHTNTSYTIV